MKSEFVLPAHGLEHGHIPAPAGHAPRLAVAFTRAGSVSMKKEIQTHIYWRKIQSRSSADRERLSTVPHYKRAVLLVSEKFTLMYDLTAFQRDLLYVIAGHEEPHGLAIKDELQNYYEVEINHGRLYPNLDTLVEKGLVEKGTLDKRTNSYTITDRGYRELEARREWESQYIEDV